MAFAPAMTPLMTNFSQDGEGRTMLFFGSLSFPFSAPTLYGSPVVIPALNGASETVTKEDDDDESCFVITQKGRENNIFSSTPKPQRSRKRTYKKKASSDTLNVVPIKVTKKRALQEYQDELVARTSLPVHNPFTPLRIVKKNSPTARIRAVWEIPQTKPSVSSQPRVTSNPTRVTNPASAVHEAHKALRQEKQRRRNSYQTRVTIPREEKTHIPQEPRDLARSRRVPIKARLTYPTINHGVLDPRHQQTRQGFSQASPRVQSDSSAIPKYHPGRGKSATGNKPTTDKKASVFDRLGARGAPQTQNSSNSLTITASSHPHKKRRVTHNKPKPDEHFAVYMVHTLSDISEGEEDESSSDTTGIDKQGLLNTTVKSRMAKGLAEPPPGASTSKVKHGTSIEPETPEGSDLDYREEVQSLRNTVEKMSEMLQALMLNQGLTGGGPARGKSTNTKNETNDAEASRPPSPVRTSTRGIKHEGGSVPPGLSKEEVKALVHREMLIAGNGRSGFPYRKTEKP